MIAHSRTLLIISTLLIFMMTGCQDKDQQTPYKVETAQSHTSKKELSVVVPDTVKGKWKAVKIAVTDKTIAKQTIYTIPIGGAFTLPNSKMTIEVEVFLPAFVMEGSSMTSSSNSLKNPGTKVRITEGSAIIFKGWLFSLFPTTHALMHPRYGFTLVDVVPN